MFYFIKNYYTRYHNTTHRKKNYKSFVCLKATLIPKPASCSVELQTVSLKDTDDQSLYYYPMCTRVNRCRGCCGHDLLACRPTKIETLNFEVRIITAVNLKLLFSLSCCKMFIFLSYLIFRLWFYNILDRENWNLKVENRCQ